MAFTVDIEPTNRCNAKCYFCPRDVTPHQGLMTEEIFDQALTRVIEFRETATKLFDDEVRVAICGLGEPLLNRHTPSFIRKVRDAGLYCSLTSNASVLDESRAREILDAGVQEIDINAGEEGEDYEAVYGLPFAKTEENIIRFAEMAGDRCAVNVVLVNHRRKLKHLDHMREFWSERGINLFQQYEVMNRGGSLFVDHMQFDSTIERSQALDLLAATGADPICAAPFLFLFVGWDGQYYLCCADWQKEVPLGSVFDTSFAAVMGDKLTRVECRDKVCGTCNHDPVNKLIEELRGIDAGTRTQAHLDEMLDGMTNTAVVFRGMLEKLGHDASVRSPAEIRAAGLDAAPKRSIPLTVV